MWRGENTYDLAANQPMQPRLEDAPNFMQLPLPPTVRMTTGGLVPSSNPLRDSLDIVENIFRLCPVEEMPEMRLVSKVWNEGCRPSWSEHKVLPLCAMKEHGHDAKSYFTSRAESNPRPRLIEKKYRICCINSPVNKMMRTYLMNNGHWITSLHLKFQYACKNLGHIADIIYCRLTPNLVSLTAGIKCLQQWQGNVRGSNRGQDIRIKLKVLKLKFEYPDGHDGVLVPVEWGHVLQHYPNLEDLQVSSNLATSAELIQLLKAIKEVKRVDATNLQHLKSFSTYDVDFVEKVFTTEAFDLLKEAELSLETLGLSFGNDGQYNAAPCRVINEAIQTQRDTLRKLYIGRCRPFRMFPVGDLPLLTCLRLDGFPFEDLNFLMYLPTLRKLDIRLYSLLLERHTENRKIKISEGPRFTSHSMLSFSCICDKPVKWTVADLHDLNFLMPGLNSLTLHLTNSTFEAVCDCWPNLQHLSILGGKVNDEGFTGLREGAMRSARRSNIRNLTALKSLRILSNDTLRTTKFTERSVNEGIGLLEHLERIEICAPKMNAMLRDLLHFSPRLKTKFIISNDVRDMDFVECQTLD